MSWRRRYVFIGAIVFTAGLIVCWGLLGAAFSGLGCFYNPPVGNKPQCAESGWINKSAIGDAAGLLAIIWLITAFLMTLYDRLGRTAVRGK